MSTTAPRPAIDPSVLLELAAALRPAAVAPVAPVLPVAAIDPGLGKSIGIAIQAVVIALMLWVGKTTYDVSITVATMSAQLTSVVSDTAKMQDRMDATEKALAINTSDDKALSATVDRLRERVRIVEGQKPVTDAGRQ